MQVAQSQMHGGSNVYDANQQQAGQGDQGQQDAQQQQQQQQQGGQGGVDNSASPQQMLTTHQAIDSPEFTPQNVNISVNVNNDQFNQQYLAQAQPTHSAQGQQMGNQGQNMNNMNNMNTMNQAGATDVAQQGQASQLASISGSYKPQSTLEQQMVTIELLKHFDEFHGELGKTVKNVNAFPLKDNLFEWHFNVWPTTDPYKDMPIHGVITFARDFPRNAPTVELKVAIRHPNVKTVNNKHYVSFPLLESM